MRRTKTSFKREDGVHYHTRDVAVMRGKFEGLPGDPASATPALETRHNQVSLGTYKEIKFPARFGRRADARYRRYRPLTDPPDRQRWIAPTVTAPTKR